VEATIFAHLAVMMLQVKPAAFVVPVLVGLHLCATQSTGREEGEGADPTVPPYALWLLKPQCQLPRHRANTGINASTDCRGQCGMRDEGRTMAVHSKVTPVVTA
jgi:hypothetical protein